MWKHFLERFRQFILLYVTSNRHEVISNSDRRPYNWKTLDPSFRGVVFNYLAPVSYDNLIERKNFTFRICKEIFNTNAFVFYFTKNFYLVDEFNELIQSFESAGLIGYTMAKYIDMNLMKIAEKNPPSALKYGNIEGFFALFYFGCAVALMCFICEIIFEYIKDSKWLKT